MKTNLKLYENFIKKYIKQQENSIITFNQLYLFFCFVNDLNVLTITKKAFSSNFKKQFELFFKKPFKKEKIRFLAGTSSVLCIKGVTISGCETILNSFFGKSNLNLVQYESGSETDRNAMENSLLVQLPLKNPTLTNIESQSSCVPDQIGMRQQSHEKTNSIQLRTTLKKKKGSDITFKMVKEWLEQKITPDENSTVKVTDLITNFIEHHKLTVENLDTFNNGGRFTQKIKTMSLQLWPTAKIQYIDSKLKGQSAFKGLIVK